MDNYNVIELVGEGSFGKVYKARRRFTGQIVVRARVQPRPSGRPPPHLLSRRRPRSRWRRPRQAIKFILKHGKSEKDIRSLRQEIEILRNLQVRVRRAHTPPSAPRGGAHAATRGAADVRGAALARRRAGARAWHALRPSPAA